MSNFNSLFGSSQVRSRRWAPRLVVAEGRAYPEELIVDQYLPIIATDPFDPSAGIVIPRGRFVSIGYNKAAGAERFAYNGSGKTPLTLHAGRDLTPIGFSVNQMYRQFEEWMLDSNTVKFEKEAEVEVPFVLSINNAHGTLRAGDRVTGYFGSTTSTSNSGSLHKGKPVRYQPKMVYSANVAASGTISLTAALYPGITPRLVYVANAGTAVPASGQAVAWNSVAGVWQYTGSTATTVIYDFGQTSEQIGGEVLRIQSLDDLLSRSDYLRWVEYARDNRLDYPPLHNAATRYPVTGVTDESVTMTNNSGRVANYANGLSVHHPISIKIQGTVVDSDGNSTTYASSDWFTLPGVGPDITVRGTFYGMYHSVNWRTGVIDVVSSITITALKISYSYLTTLNGAALWGGGVLGLTDGQNVNTLSTTPQSGAAGIPTHLDFADVIAAMRIIVA